MNEKFEKYLKDLSPELKEKAKDCKTQEDLNEFLADNDLELPEEALELVAGGCGTNSGGTYHPERKLDPAYPAKSRYVK